MNILLCVYELIEKRHNKISWDIIKHKLLYYVLFRPEISDDEYDYIEKQYLLGCVYLNKENTLVHKTYVDISGYEGDGMVEVDFSRYSVQLVYNKLIRSEEYVEVLKWYQTKHI